jgi:hypothetical protein
VRDGRNARIVRAWTGVPGATPASRRAGAGGGVGHPVEVDHPGFLLTTSTTDDTPESKPSFRAWHARYALFKVRLSRV